MASTHASHSPAHVGDWIEARGISGQRPRRGQILELLGHGRHERYPVRWDEKHESIVYPADGVVIIPTPRPRRARRSPARRDAEAREGASGSRDEGQVVTTSSLLGRRDETSDDQRSR